MQDLCAIFLQLIFLIQKQLSIKHSNSLTQDDQIIRFTTSHNTIFNFSPDNNIQEMTTKLFRNKTTNKHI